MTSPKIHILSADANGQLESTVRRTLLDHLPNLVSESEADVLIVPISYLHVFTFNEHLLDITKKYILLDFCEYGWDAGMKQNQWGVGAVSQFSHLNTPHYVAFDQWVQDRPPMLTLKRELPLRDKSPTMMPVEWPCERPALLLQTKEEFNARPMEVFSCWGLSNPARPRLHGNIFHNAHDYNIHVMDNWADAGRFESRNWATIFSPYHRRTHINEIMKWNRQAKLSVSLPGAGVKCFRSVMEAPVGSIVAMQGDALAWSHSWDHGVNCIRLVPGDEFAGLEAATHRSDLWELYCECQNTLDRYRSARYVAEYIMPTIEAIL